MLKPRVFVLLFPLLLGVSYFYNSWTQPLLADEPTRAIVSLEMLLRGDAFPTINNEAYLNKPPLYNLILVPFLMVFGEAEWVVRLPAILSLLALGYLIFYFYQKITGDKEGSFFTAMAFLTSGNILFYSSLLGHIDATFSIVIFAHFMLCYLLGSSGKWNLLFRWSYVLCFIGFMLKGLPSICGSFAFSYGVVFQTIQTPIFCIALAQYALACSAYCDLFCGIFTILPTYGLCPKSLGRVKQTNGY